MSRYLFFSILIIGGCSGVDRPAAVQPPALGQPIEYDDLATRLRAQASACIESYYRDDFAELQHQAEIVGQTAAFLKTVDVPAEYKAHLIADQLVIARDCNILIEQAKAKNIEKMNDTLRALHAHIRGLPVIAKP